MTNKQMESIKRRLRGIYQLAVNGATEGEKENALRLYEELMAKYNLQPGDLGRNNTSRAEYKYRRPQERSLIFQVLAKVLNTQSLHFRKPNDDSKRIWVELTPSEKAEVDLLLRTYRRPHEEEMKAIMEEARKKLDLATAAFFAANRIYPPSPEDREERELTAEELQRLEEVLAMARNMRKTHVFRKDRALTA